MFCGGSRLVFTTTFGPSLHSKFSCVPCKVQVRREWRIFIIFAYCLMLIVVHCGHTHTHTHIVVIQHLACTPCSSHKFCIAIYANVLCRVRG